MGLCAHLSEVVVIGLNRIDYRAGDPDKQFVGFRRNSRLLFLPLVGRSLQFYHALPMGFADRPTG